MVYIPDIITVDRDDQPILIGEVRAPETISPHLEAEILTRLKSHRAMMPGGEGVHHGLIADPVRIRFYDLDRDDPAPLWSSPTRDVMLSYTTHFPGNTGIGDRVSERLLQGMIGSWLRDLTYDWKHLEDPPGKQAFEAAGLLDRMGKGWTGSGDQMAGLYIGREVPFASDALR